MKALPHEEEKMVANEEVHSTNVALARDQYFGSGDVPTGLVSDSIAASWRRCRDLGLKAGDPGTDAALMVDRQRDILEQNRSLLTYARPVMENLFAQIANTDSVVLLADANSMIVHSLGDPSFIGKADKVRLMPGFSWEERHRGTNAIGTALVEERPLVVHGGEHYLDRNLFLTCAASPVLDTGGRPIGVLDISGECRSHQRHTLALVQMSAQMIENRMLMSEFGKELVVSFHARPEFLGTLCEGIAVFSLEGKLLAANRSALFQLELKRADVPRQRFSQLFDTRIDEALNYVRFGGREHFSMLMKGGIRLFAHLRCGAVTSKPLFFGGGASAAEPARNEEPAPAAAAKTSRPGFPLTLNDLMGGDLRIEVAATKVRKILGKDIPLLIEGETGTGKEMFAQAFHMSGPRRDKPFVAVNCAAIPEGLIESELFGYQDGAFTGARKKGNLGKILQADGGTLFLDEIGDMPFNLQARLLRVLQEREVVPLGAARAVPVDILLVTATNRKLREEVERGNFREDLYYRVNGLRITLPPLRERTDLDRIAQSLLVDEAGPARSVEISDEVLQLFRAYRWPGNIRQMRSILRTALALLDGGDLLEEEHLPEDIVEELERAAAAGLIPTAAPVLSAAPLIPMAVAPPISPPVAGGANLAEIELAAIHRALDECQGNVSAAARRLGISRNTLYRKLGRL
ncbi:MAG: sigma-54-dependent Fis family transcriptional regulator [Rhodocyclaceae bacterium]|nr:sigma-54-dependent Fis family transcriptional regulator [Rhodocyclaceae bacterium]